MNILCLTSYYLPSYKAGGPIKSIKNMVDYLEGYQFYILTRDRDIGDKCPHSGLSVLQWIRQKGCTVLYIPPSFKGYYKVYQELLNSAYDVVYLNSFFDFKYSFLWVFLYKCSKSEKKPFIIAPRGEFSPGALAVKKVKKHIYIYVARFLGLYKNVFWHASTEHEKIDIVRAMGINKDMVLVAKDFPDILRQQQPPEDLDFIGQLRCIFLSRVSPKKNLLFALSILKQVDVLVRFDIYGPLEDLTYWDECRQVISELPLNITVTYKGVVNPEKVSALFSNYDLFLFPTKGENYGHVIAESLLVGTPVLTSDQTPWRNLEAKGLGWELCLQLGQKTFSEKIVAHYEALSSGNALSRAEIAEKAVREIYDEQDIEDNKQLFQSAIDRFKERNIQS